MKFVLRIAPNKVLKSIPKGEEARRVIRQNEKMCLTLGLSCTPELGRSNILSGVILQLAYTF